MRFMKELGVPHDKVNVNGGAIAMGHPLGATGAMILNTLIDELHRRKLRYGMATLCVGGGMGIATIVESCEHETIKYELADGIADHHLRRAGLAGQHHVRAVAARAGRGHGAGRADKEAIKGIVLASNKSTFFAGATSRARCACTQRRAARVRRDRADQEVLPHPGDPGQAGGQSA
jgi:hypothetical protein